MTIPTFNKYMQHQIKDLLKSGKTRTAETYRTTMNRFDDFLGGREIHFTEINAELIDRFEDYLTKRGVSRNTSSFYMRILRAVYNRGVDKGWTSQRRPFRHTYTGVDKTRKRAVTLQVIRQLHDMDLTGRPCLAKARDIFLFSFYTRGMSFVDMAYLRREDLHGDMLRYTRRKTGQELCIRWEPVMQEIVDRYPLNPNGFLLPIITETDIDFRQQYKNAILRTNEALAKISEMLGLEVALTTYVARHSWASIAYNRSVPLALISEAMGHDSERTTRIYLASVSNAGVDRANHKIISMLL
jgi:site-specific recombinase XerD